MSMKRYAGLDVSVRETSICIIDADGRIVREVKIASEGDALVIALQSIGVAYERIGIEAGPLSQHLYCALTKAGLPIICVETRHMQAALSAQRLNKTDRHDARGIARMMRVGLYKPVHVKTPRSQRLRMLLTTRKLLGAKLLDIENDLRGTRNFGLKVGKVSPAAFEARVRELATGDPIVAAIVEPVLTARRALREQVAVLHKMLLDVARRDDICRRLMTVPGVGPVVALTFRATVDQPARFARSRSVGAHFGLTPRRYQSGETDWTGRISKSGDAMMRTALYEAAQVLLTRVTRWSSLRAWAIRVARHRGRKKAVVAVARRLAVILHRIWVDGTEFRWGEQPAPA
jgi:transposase